MAISLENLVDYVASSDNNQSSRIDYFINFLLDTMVPSGNRMLSYRSVATISPSTQSSIIMNNISNYLDNDVYPDFKYVGSKFDTSFKNLLSGYKDSDAMKLYKDTAINCANFEKLCADFTSTMGNLLSDKIKDTSSYNKDYVLGDFILLSSGTTISDGTLNININKFKKYIKNIIKFKLLIYNQINTDSQVTINDLSVNQLVDKIISLSKKEYTKALGYALGYNRVSGYDVYYNLNVNYTGGIGSDFGETPNFANIGGKYDGKVCKSKQYKPSYSGGFAIPLSTDSLISHVMISIMYMFLIYYYKSSKSFGNGYVLSPTLGINESKKIDSVTHNSVYRDSIRNNIGIYGFSSYKARVSPHNMNYCIDIGANVSTTSAAEYGLQNVSSAYISIISNLTSNIDTFVHFMKRFTNGFIDSTGIVDDTGKFEIMCKYAWIYSKFMYRFFAYPSGAVNLNHIHVDFNYLPVGKNNYDVFYNKYNFVLHTKEDGDVGSEMSLYELYVKDVQYNKGPLNSNIKPYLYNVKEIDPNSLTANIINSIVNNQG